METNQLRALYWVSSEPQAFIEPKQPSKPTILVGLAAPNIDVIIVKLVFGIIKY